MQIVDEHAAIIRDVFARYLACGNVRLVAEQLAREGIRAPVRHRIRSGAAFGGVTFTCGQIHAFLSCPTYVGEIHHQGRVHTALHAPIIDRATWDAVQRRLAGNVQGKRRGSRTPANALLAGIIVDSAGTPLLSGHASKPAPNKVEGSTVRYRYYAGRPGSGTHVRVPAPEIEVAMTRTLVSALNDPLALAASMALVIRPTDLHGLTDRAAELAGRIASRDRILLRELVTQVRVLPDTVEVDLAAPYLVTKLQVVRDADASPIVTLRADMRLTRTGRAVRLVQGDGLAATGKPDPAVIALVLKARRWWDTLREGKLDVSTLAAREGVTSSWVTWVLRLAFLAPPVVEALLAGKLRAGVDGAVPLATGGVEASWRVQQRAMLAG